MEANIDVVIGRAPISIDELVNLEKSKLIALIENEETTVYLKSNDEIIASGSMVKVDGQLYVLIESVESELILKDEEE